MENQHFWIPRANETLRGANETLKGANETLNVANEALRGDNERLRIPYKTNGKSTFLGSASCRNVQRSERNAQGS